MSSRVLVALVAVAALAGCKSTTGPGIGGLLFRTELAEAQWAAGAPARYRMTLQVGCGECLPDMARAVRLEVERAPDGTETVTSRVYVDTGEPVSEQLAANFPSVSGLHQLVRDAMAARASRLDVTYHPSLGYPAAISIDYHQQMVDDEVSYSVTSFAAL